MGKYNIIKITISYEKKELMIISKTYNLWLSQKGSFRQAFVNNCIKINFVTTNKF